MSALDLFVEEARAVSLSEAVDRLGLHGLKGGATGERVGPCPACGGTDRFGVNVAKGVWNCRGCGGKGGDAIGLAALVNGRDYKRDFLLACADVLGRPVPDGSAESAEEIAARERRLAEGRAASAAKAAKDAAAAAEFREKERAKARGKWDRATLGGRALDYLRARLGGSALPELPFLRTIADEAYWHGKDEMGRAASIHDGPAMVAPFVDGDGRVIGCHLTWIDMTRGPKFRPVLVDGEGEPLPTKKMRGTKQGGLIPLVGFGADGGVIFPEPGRTRLVCGEGIENTLAVALIEGVRGDTLYAAAGDLGNLAGAADPASSFSHPSLKNKGGRAPLRVAGPVPREGADEAMPVPAGVRDVLLIGDADSEPVATGSAMLRAERRIRAFGCEADTLWPPEGIDFADLFTDERILEGA